MRRARTRCFWIEERTLRIGFGIKRASQHQVTGPEFLALGPPLGGRQAVPLRPFPADKLFRKHHGATLPRLWPDFKDFVLSLPTGFSLSPPAERGERGTYAMADEGRSGFP